MGSWFTAYALTQEVIMNTKLLPAPFEALVSNGQISDIWLYCKDRQTWCSVCGKPKNSNLKYIKARKGTKSLNRVPVVQILIRDWCLIISLVVWVHSYFISGQNERGNDLISHLVMDTFWQSKSYQFCENHNMYETLFFVHNKFLKDCH